MSDVILGCMLDLETMGNTPNAAVIAIGAVIFTRDRVLEDTFYRTVSLKNAVSRGLSMDPDTVLWWLTQDSAAQEEFLQRNDEGVPLAAALASFSMWLNDIRARTTQPIEVWGNGAAFDNVILANAYRQIGAETPWPFWMDRCYRTMKALNKHVPFPEFEGTPHHAMHDARHQARHLVNIFAMATQNEQHS